MPDKIVIQNMFDSIAHRYDLLNNLLSFGIHWIWKRRLVKEVLKLRPKNVLDIATGTGDVAGLISKEGINVTGVDISEQMLKVAKVKYSDLEFFTDDITNSKIESDSYDVCCISYGIRNVSNLALALSEMKRISKAAVILEFGRPSNLTLRKIYFMVMHKVVPFIGGMFSKKDSYHYLIESSERFPSGDVFLELAQSVVEPVECKKIALFGGITYIYILKF